MPPAPHHKLKPALLAHRARRTRAATQAPHHKLGFKGSYSLPFLPFFGCLKTPSGSCALPVDREAGAPPRTGVAGAAAGVGFEAGVGAAALGGSGVGSGARVASAAADVGAVVVALVVAGAGMLSSSTFGRVIIFSTARGVPKPGPPNADSTFRNVAVWPMELAAA
jgi:hypothetical protein